MLGFASKQCGYRLLMVERYLLEEREKRRVLKDS